jgi:hypothetical protein
MRRLPGPADNRPGDGGDSRGSLRIVSGLAVNTNSIFCDGPVPRGSKWMSGSAGMQEPPAERHRCAAAVPDQLSPRALRSAYRDLVLFP